MTLATVVSLILGAGFVYLAGWYSARAISYEEGRSRGYEVGFRACEEEHKTGEHAFADVDAAIAAHKRDGVIERLGGRPL